MRVCSQRASSLQRLFIFRLIVGFYSFSCVCFSLESWSSTMSWRKVSGAAPGGSWRSVPIPTGEDGSMDLSFQLLPSFNPFGFWARITRFLEKPEEGRTASRLASVVFYCLRRDTLSCMSNFLSLYIQATERIFGLFWVRRWCSFDWFVALLWPYFLSIKS